MHWGRCPFFVEVVGFGRAPLPFFPALAGCAVAVSSCSCESQFPFGRSRRRVNVGEVGLGNACCFRLRRAAKRNGAFAGRCCVFLRVAGFSAITALAGYPYFGNHSSCGERGVVNHRPRVYPMHHSVLPEEGGVEPRGRLSSSRQAVAREDRVAKRNPELARACTGGGVPFSLRWWVSEEHLFRFFLHLRVALLPFPPALASPSFRLAGQGVALTLGKWVSEMRVVFG